MLKSKSALFISLLFATQLASAGGMMLEKQTTPPFDESLNGTVILECQPDNGSVILEKGIIVQDKLAGVVILENTPDIHDEGAVILERGIIVQKNQLAGGVILEDLHLAGGLIIDRHGRANGQSLSA